MKNSLFGIYYVFYLRNPDLSSFTTTYAIIRRLPGLGNSSLKIIKRSVFMQWAFCIFT